MNYKIKSLLYLICFLGTIALYYVTESQEESRRNQIVVVEAEPHAGIQASSTVN